MSQSNPRKPFIPEITDEILERTYLESGTTTRTSKIAGIILTPIIAAIIFVLANIVIAIIAELGNELLASIIEDGDYKYEPIVLLVLLFGIVVLITLVLYASGRINSFFSKKLVQVLGSQSH